MANKGLRLVVQINASDLFDTLLALDEALDVNEIVAEAATIILNNTRRRFLMERDPMGEKWPPSEAAIKRRKKHSTGTLFETGALWRSIQETSDTGSQGNLFGAYAEKRITAGVENEKGVEYGHFHQFGIGQVQRRFLGVNPHDVELFENRLLQRCAEALGVA